MATAGSEVRAPIFSQPASVFHGDSAGSGVGDYGGLTPGVYFACVDHCARMADTEKRQEWAQAQFRDGSQYQTFMKLVIQRRESEREDQAASRESAIRHEIERLDILDEARRRWHTQGCVPSWGQIDPAEALEAARTPREPEAGRFQGEPSHGVFYAGCVNGVHGESESGKSWLTLYVTAQELVAGHVVAYVDYEDDEGSVYRRLRLLGVSETLLLQNQFRYHRPNGPMTEAEKIIFMKSAEGADTVIFDGVTEGMTLEGLDGRLEKDVAAWHGKVTKDLAHAGKCVVVVDHVPHGGNRAIGSQHKKAGLTGVSYLAEPVQPVGTGRRGVLRLRVEKDRHASVRREAAPGDRPQWRGDLVIDFSEVQPHVALFPASPRDEGCPKPVPKLSEAQLTYLRALAEYAALGASGTTIGRDTDKARSVAEKAMVRLGRLGCVAKIGTTSRFAITELGARALAEAEQTSGTDQEASE